MQINKIKKERMENLHFLKKRVNVKVINESEETLCVLTRLPRKK